MMSMCPPAGSKNDVRAMGVLSDRPIDGARTRILANGTVFRERRSHLRTGLISAVFQVCGEMDPLPGNGAGTSQQSRGPYSLDLWSSSRPMGSFETARSWHLRDCRVTQNRTECAVVWDHLSVAIQRTQRRCLIAYLESRPAVCARDLEAAGFSAARVSRAVRSGDIVRLGRGLYSLPDSLPDTHAPLIEVGKRAPAAVVCLTSALAFHGLTDQLPRRVWIALGAKDREPSITFPKIRIVRFREPYFSGDIENHRIGGLSIRMYSLPKTLAYGFGNQRFIDQSVAIEAVQTALAQRKATPSAIAEAARHFGVWNQMRPYVEAMTSTG